MAKIDENKSVNLKDLKKSGRYSNKLLFELGKGDFNTLADLSIKQKNERDFIMPILYALRNEYNTYIAYKYCGTGIKEDESLAREIVKKEPFLLENTPLSNNKVFIKSCIEINPNIVTYMSIDLKKDEKFVKDICDSTDNPQVKREIIEAYQIAAIKDNILLRKSGSIK